MKGKHSRAAMLIWIWIVIFSLASLAGAELGFLEREAFYQNGGIELAALMLIPEGKGPFPAAVLIQGAGDSDRSNQWARSIAEFLANHGITSLLTDKRGCGKSGGDWHTAGFDVLAADTLAGVEYLKAQKEILAEGVGVIGLSQGGFYAPLVGTMSNDVAFVISVSGAAVTPLEQVNHEMENTFRQAGLDDSGVAAGMRLQNLAAQYVRTGDWTTYKNNLQAAMASPLRPIAENFPQTQDSWVWAWWEKIGTYDPITYWKLLKQPALILFGEEDEFDNVPVKESIVRLENSFKGIKKDITIRVYPGSGHGLFEPGTETRSLREEAFQLLTSWVLKRTMRQ